MEKGNGIRRGASIVETTIKWCNKKITLILSLIYKTILLSHYIIFNLCAPFLWGKEPQFSRLQHRLRRPVNGWCQHKIAAINISHSNNNNNIIRAPHRVQQHHSAEEEESVCSALICRHKFYGQFIYIIADWNCNSTPSHFGLHSPVNVPSTLLHPVIFNRWALCIMRTPSFPLSCQHTSHMDLCVFLCLSLDWEQQTILPAPGVFAYITRSSNPPNLRSMILLN